MIFDWTDTGAFMVPEEDAPRNYYGGFNVVALATSSLSNHADKAFEKTGVPIEIGVFESSTRFPTVLGGPIDIGTDANLDWDSDTEDLALKTGGTGFDDFYDAVEGSTELPDGMDPDEEMEDWSVEELTSALQMASNALSTATLKFDIAKAAHDLATQLLRQASKENKPAARGKANIASSNLEKARQVKARAEYYRKAINEKLQEKKRGATKLSKKRRLEDQQDMRDQKEAKAAADAAEKKKQREAKAAANAAEKKEQREAANKAMRDSLIAKFNHVKRFVDAKKPDGTVRIVVVITDTLWYDFFYDKERVFPPAAVPITAIFLFGNFSTYITDVLSTDLQDKNRHTRITMSAFAQALANLIPSTGDFGFYSKDDIERFTVEKELGHVYAKTTGGRLQEWIGSVNCSAKPLTKEFISRFYAGLLVYVGS